MNATMCPSPVGPVNDIPTEILTGPHGADMHFHGEYTDNTTTNSTTTGRGADSPTVTRECLASADLAVAWLLDNALGHPKTITIRINSRGQQHWFEPAPRPHTTQPTPVHTRTRRQMTDVIRPAIARGDAVRATVTISSVVRPRTFTVTPHPHPCPHHPSTTSADHHKAGS